MDSKTRKLLDDMADTMYEANGVGLAAPQVGVSIRAVVIDVGMNRSAEGKLIGDVDTAAAMGIASHITPVPGGVGPMTITMLLQQTIDKAK